MKRAYSVDLARPENGFVALFPLGVSNASLPRRVGVAKSSTGRKNVTFSSDRGRFVLLYASEPFYATLSILLPAARNHQKEHARLEMEQKSGLIDVNVRSTLDKERIYRFQAERTSRNYRVTFGHVSCRG